MKQIKSVADLRRSIADGQNEFFILLNYGLRSSKTIYEDEDGNFEIVNEIDGSEQLLSADELFDEGKTNIGKAIKFGSFYQYGDN